MLARRRAALPRQLGRQTCVAFCPRHGASFDIRSGRALTLPAYLPVRTFPVHVDDGVVKVTTG